jgi:tRNA(fMet)-specific endonuclease VapC
MYSLDTNACIHLLNGSSDALTARLRQHSPAEIYLCSVVKAELIHGAHRSSRTAENLRLLERFFAPFVSVPFDDECAVQYGQIRAELERQGTPIGPHDLLIAATALVNDLTLVTNNVREFGRVLGLRVEDWQSA